MKKTAQLFQCDLNTVQHALVLKSEHDILAKPAWASRKSTGEEIISFVHSFYQDGEFLRSLQTHKDFVGIGYEVHQQK